MIRLIINIIFCLCFTLPVFSQQLKEISVSGNHIFSQDDFNRSIKIPTGIKIYPEISDTISRRISLFMYEEGYYNFSLEVSPVDSASDTLFINIDEGKPTFCHNISFENNSLTDSVLVAGLINSLAGKIFSKVNIENTFTRALNHFELNGRPFYSIKIDSLYHYDSENEHKVDLRININEGPLCKLDEIIVEGNTKTKEYVIERELRIGKSELYNQEIIDDIPQTLNKTGFFRTVNPPEFFLNENNEGILKISLEEKNTNTFDGILGYVPGSGSQSGYFTGFVNIGLRNLFGTGRSAQIKWNQETKSTQELELRYHEPWIFSFPFSLRLGMYQRKQDSLYVQRNINAGFEYVADRNISAGILLASESTIPSENSLPQNNVYNSSLLTTGISFTIDTRDDLYSPSSGLLFINSYKYTSKKIDEATLPGITSNNNLQRFETDFNYFQKIFSSQVISLALHAREMKGSFIELSDLYFLGGTSSLRGYRERQFSGNRLFWSNLEYRYLFDLRSYFFLFFDAGYFMRREEPVLSIPFFDDVKTGYGLGISLETAIGILKVSYALGEGDDFSNGKIHFGIANDF